MRSIQSKILSLLIQPTLHLSSHELQINAESLELAAKHNFEIKSYGFTAEKEDLRPARIVKVAGVQNSIVLPTTDPVGKQRDALFEKIGEMSRS